MGGKLARAQSTSERTKLCPIKSEVFLKYGARKNARTLINSDIWRTVPIMIHQTLLTLDNRTTLRIDKHFLIISQNETNLDIIFVVSKDSEENIYIVRCMSMRQFKDIALAILFSKRPSWIVSPICQCCSAMFTMIRRDHHCRNCGKNICGACSRYSALEISGYLGRKRICLQCEDLVANSIRLVIAIQCNEFNMKSKEGLYYCPSQSLLVDSLRE